MAQFIKVADCRQVRRESPMPIELNGKKIVLYYVDGEYFASEQGCPHMGAPMNEGVVSGKEVVCRLHLWAFDLKTGKCTSDVTSPVDLKVYPVKVEGRDLLIGVDG